MQTSQQRKAADFLNQHQPGKLLILPNIWDALGAKILEQSGYKAVATASVATSLTHGFLDGERISFTTLLETVKKISTAVQIPVSVDIERGFANTIGELKDNIQKLIEQGGIGINLEDSKPDQRSLYTTEEQCRKIEAVKETGIRMGVPIVINARTDVFLIKSSDKPFEEALHRAMAFKKAGADCVYPIMISKYEEIEQLVKATGMPVNVNLQKPVSDLKRLEQIGVARVSVGPQLLNHVLSYMKQLAEELKNYDTTLFYSRELLTRDYLNKLVQ